VLIGKQLTKFLRISLSALQDLKSLAAEVASSQLLISVTCLTKLWPHILQYLNIDQSLCGKFQVSQDQTYKKNYLKYKTYQEDKTQSSNEHYVQFNVA
jgi:hypothetical protein